MSRRGRGRKETEWSRYSVFVFSVCVFHPLVPASYRSVIIAFVGLAGFNDCVLTLASSGLINLAFSSFQVSDALVPEAVNAVSVIIDWSLGSNVVLVCTGTRTSLNLKACYVFTPSPTVFLPLY